MSIVKIGKNCTIAESARIGTIPVSNYRDETGRWHRNNIGTKDVIIGDDVFIGDNVVIQYGAKREVKIEENAVIDSNTSIAHDVQIGRSSHVSLGGILLGGCTIGHFSRIFAGSIIHQNVTIGNNCIVGAGSYVRHDVPDNTVVYGTPAKEASNVKYPHTIYDV